MCQGGMPAFCQKTLLESSPPLQEDELLPSLTSGDPREDGELSNDDEEEGAAFRSNNPRGGSKGGSRKRIAVLGDQQSSGRKMAHRLFPLNRSSPCEWQGKAHNGGGSYPILGCLQGTQQAAHHGPDKNTSNNEVGNVHRICNACHVRWHVKNDPDYDWNATVYPLHEPRPMNDAEKAEAIIADMKYQSGKLKKVND
jgi:hypothetical protein